MKEKKSAHLHSFVSTPRTKCLERLESCVGHACRTKCLFLKSKGGSGGEGEQRGAQRGGDTEPDATDGGRAVVRRENYVMSRRARSRAREGRKRVHVSHARHPATEHKHSAARHQEGLLFVRPDPRTLPGHDKCGTLAH